MLGLDGRSAPGATTSSMGGDISHRFRESMARLENVLSGSGAPAAGRTQRERAAGEADAFRAALAALHIGPTDGDDWADRLRRDGSPREIAGNVATVLNEVRAGLAGLHREVLQLRLRRRWDPPPRGAPDRRR